MASSHFLARLPTIRLRSAMPGAGFLNRHGLRLGPGKRAAQEARRRGKRASRSRKKKLVPDAKARAVRVRPATGRCVGRPAKKLVPFPWVKKQATDLVCLLKAQADEQRARLQALSAATPGAVDHAAPGDASGVCDQCETCTTSFQKFCSECGQPTKQRARFACSTPAPQGAGMLGG